MGDSGSDDASQGSVRWSSRLRATILATAAVAAAAILPLTGCAPEFNWREIPAPGDEYRIQLPAKPATLTRTIHLESRAVDMTMLGARVGETSFAVAVVALPEAAEAAAQVAAPAADQIVAAMRAQMLRNIGASPTTPVEGVEVDLVDLEGRRIGRVPMLSVEAVGTGAHSGIRLQARFGHWQGRALQAVIVGPPIAAVQSQTFFDSLRLLRR